MVAASWCVSSVSTGGSGTNAHGDARPHSAAHRCAIDAGVMNTDAAHANTGPSSPVRESVSGASRDAGNADDDGCCDRDNASL